MALRADRRSLVYAIGLSLALHAAVLALRLPVPTGAQRGAPPIVAYLAPTEAPAVLMGSAMAKARPATRGAQATPSAAPPPIPAAEPALDEATAIARYRYELIGTALRYKRYPAEAIGSGLEGEVVVRVTVTGGGTTMRWRSLAVASRGSSNWPNWPFGSRYTTRALTSAPHACGRRGDPRRGATRRSSR